jgi:hypothetical protein
MRRGTGMWIAGIVAAALIAACGAKTPLVPTGSGGSGGGSTGGSGGGTTANTPPIVKSIAVSNANAEVGTPITVTATVEDAETALDKLAYTWSAPNGAFAGTGSIVTWTAGADAKTPTDITLTLTVTETYTSGSTQQTNTATGTVSVHVNNSPKELADLSLRFLGNFADSKVSPDTCVADFSPSCNGKKDEFADITNNRHDFLILSSTLRHTGIDPAAPKAKTTVHTFCAFTSRVIAQQPWGCSPADCPFNTVQSVQGDCYTTNVYEQGRWWLCESHFNPSRTLTAVERAFFGIRKPEIP